MRWLLWFLLLSLSFSNPSPVQAEQTLVLAVSKAQATYGRFARDLVIQAKKVDLQVKPLPTQGDLDSVQQLFKRRSAITVALLRADVLDYLTQAENQAMQSAAQSLRLIHPLYTETVHFLALKAVKGLADLTGQQIGVASDDRAGRLTARQLLGQHDVTMQGKGAARFVHLTPKAGMAALIKGEIAAYLVVITKPALVFKAASTWPSGVTKKTLMTQFHFIPINQERLIGTTYESTQITAADYPWLTASTPTVGVKTVLASKALLAPRKGRSWQHCRVLERLGQLLTEKAQDFKNTGHPYWLEVDLTAAVAGWSLTDCSPAKVGASPLSQHFDIEHLMKRKGFTLRDE